MIMDDKLCVHARLALGSRIFKIRIVGIALIEGAESPHHPVRNQLDVAARRCAADATQSCSLPQAAWTL